MEQNMTFWEIIGMIAFAVVAVLYGAYFSKHIRRRL